MVNDNGWAGDNPFHLLIARDDKLAVIDLDERGWLQTHKDLLRGESTWHLASKGGGIAFSLVVLDGEQPYYLARHFARGPEQVVAYGIGKKRRDGHVDRLWIFYPSGQVCTGDDVDILGRAMLARM
jgi:hypothetical protein